MNNIDDISIAALDLGAELVFDPNEAAWDKLTEQVVAGNVIPVIGSDILCEDRNIHTQLVELLARKFSLKTNPTSFTELVYDHDFLKAINHDEDNLYVVLNAVFRQIVVPPSRLLRTVLGIRQFPFVITTSFTPIVETVMRENWGNELRVMRFGNDPKTNSDITDETDLRKPTVYYMFGRVGEGAHRYALTDNDMLDFCTSWVAETDRRPKLLTKTLKNKYLLMLGNNHSDWLFRFIWYAVRNSSGGDGLYAYQHGEDELLRFLERHHTFIRRNPAEVVEQIVERLAVKLERNEHTKFENVETDADVFISYSRADEALARQLYEQLTKMGVRVWYDRKDITHGGRFMDEIRRGIRTARYFVPIFTKNVEEERNAPHVYREEWEVARQVGIRLGRTYIIPVAESGFDFYNANIPENMQQHNAIEFTGMADLKRVAELIIHTMNQS